MRIAVFVDGANFFYMQKDQLGWFVDPRLLLDFIKTKGDIVDAFYYTGKGVPPEARQENFLMALTHMGYSLVTKDLKTTMQSNGTLKQKANLDVEIVLDMFNTIDNYDMAVLVSGDGDFERPLSQLKSRGKKFLVMSTAGFVAKEIRSVAGMHFIDFIDIKDAVQKVV